MQLWRRRPYPHPPDFSLPSACVDFAGALFAGAASFAAFRACSSSLACGVLRRGGRKGGGALGAAGWGRGAALPAEDEAHYAATDGGCLLAREADFQQRAAWAVSFGGATFSGLVQGPEQTAAEGERVAVYVLAAALLLQGRRV